MLDWLLLLINILLCFAILGYVYYLFRVKHTHTHNHDDLQNMNSQSQYADSIYHKPHNKYHVNPEHSENIECNNLQESTPVSKKTEEPEKCKECPLILGFKIETQSQAIKKIIHKVNEMNSIVSQSFCINKNLLKLKITSELDNLYKKKPELANVSCAELSRIIKNEIMKQNQPTTFIKEEMQIEILLKMIDILEIIIPDEVCVNNKLEKTKVLQIMSDIIDAFCDSSEVYVETGKSFYS